jgi:outer membrane murein-binding lipoprotein Lpp
MAWLVNNSCLLPKSQARTTCAFSTRLFNKERRMKNASTVFLVVMMFSSLGLWGCTHQKNGAYHSKIRELESRYTKLEEDYKAVLHSSDQLRKKVGQIEAQRAELSKKVDLLEGIAKERDELRTQLAARTSERDNLHGQMSQFRKDVQDLVGRMDVALQPTAGSVNAVPASRASE